MTRRLARDFGIDCGLLPAGRLNALTDVAGVLVGHRTVTGPGILTGFTAIRPHPGNLYREKLPAAVHVINGFGKSAGLMQLAELGSLETPILLTNTFAVAVGVEALVRVAIAANPDIGRQTATVNPVVGECNDGWLNDIQAPSLSQEDALAALNAAASGPVEQGAIGAGAGMSAFGFKGGIGTASRRLELDGLTHHLGLLVLANFGRPGDLLLPDGRRPVPVPGGGAATDASAATDKGSVIMILATDVPLEHRQLERVARRCGVGLARLGSLWGHGSGDVVIAFSTAQRIYHDEPRDLISFRVLNENRIELLFRAAAEATHEAVLNAMLAAPATVGRDGHSRPSLADWLIAGEAP